MTLCLLHDEQLGSGDFLCNCIHLMDDHYRFIMIKHHALMRPSMPHAMSPKWMTE